MQFAGATQDHAHAEINEISAANKLHDHERPRGRGQECRETKRRCNCVTNTADADPERRSNAGASPLRNTTPKNVGGVGSGSKIEKYSCCQKQGEMMNRAQTANSLGNGLHHHAHAIGFAQH